jgi:hypothetical protein
MAKITISMSDKSSPPDRRRFELHVAYGGKDATINLPVDPAQHAQLGTEAVVLALHDLMDALDRWTKESRKIIPGPLG